MPVTKSAKKALRRDRRRTLINIRTKKKLKLSLKKMRTDPSADNLKEAYQNLDRAAKKKYLHHKKADRLKSRLSKLLSKQTPKASPAKKVAAKKAPKAVSKTKKKA